MSKGEKGHFQPRGAAKHVVFYMVSLLAGKAIFRYIHVSHVVVHVQENVRFDML